jgi:hypothetical protein
MRRTQAITLAHTQYPLDVHLPHFVQGQRPPFVSLRRPLTAMLQVLGQLRKINEVTGRRNASAGNNILQFTHVAWPPMLQHTAWARRVNPGIFFP